MATKYQKQLLGLGVVAGLGWLLFMRKKKSDEPPVDATFTEAELRAAGFYNDMA